MKDSIKLQKTEKVFTNAETSGESFLCDEIGEDRFNRIGGSINNFKYKVYSGFYLETDDNDLLF